MSENMSEVTAAANAAIQQSDLARTIDWKQGIIIAMGVPILILPSIFDLAGNVWGLSVLIWVISVCQGFLQNMAIGELSATFGVAGIGAAAQYVFKDDEKYKDCRVNWGRFIGAFTAWAYWFTWTPVIPIFTIMTGYYLQSQFDFLAGINSTILNLVIGAMIYSMIIFIGSKGLAGGAKVQLLLAIVTIVPLIVVVTIPFLNGHFSMDTFSDSFYKTGWDWGEGSNIAMFLGCLAVAQWSACAWESAATYGAEYKNPGRDVPKALIGCGLICLLMYFLVSFSVFGTLGITGVMTWGYSTLVPVCQYDFGDIGSYVAVILLVAGMIMLIQTAFLGSSRTLFFMSKNGNMPLILSKTTKTGAPIYAMAFQFCVGICMIPLGTPGMILAASSFGFCFALGMAMLAFVKARRDPRFKDVPRTFRAPRGWYYVAICLAIFQFFVLIPCLAYESIMTYGMSSVLVGAVILLIYVPLWLYLHSAKYLEKRNAAEKAMAA